MLDIKSDQIILSWKLPLRESGELQLRCSAMIVETKCQKDLIEKTSNQVVSHGVIWYDYAVPIILSISLNHSVDKFSKSVSGVVENILVNPSSYPYVHGSSSILNDNVNKLFKPSQLNCDRWNRFYVYTKYQWIATNVMINGEQVKFKSCINGIDESNLKLYNELEKLFGLFLNKLAAVLWFTRNYQVKHYDNIEDLASKCDVVENEVKLKNNYF